MKIFFRLSAILTVACIISAPFAAAMPVKAAASSAGAIDVHITGNFVVGQTLTAEYTYYDPEGLPEDVDGVEYRWYNVPRNSNGNGTVLSTEKTYTPNTDTLRNLFVSVTTKNANGQGAPVYSSIYGEIQNPSEKTAPTISKQHIVSLSPDGTITAGDTLRARYTYVHFGGIPEGETLFVWETADSYNGPYTQVQAESTNRDYTVKESDFGKWIRVTIKGRASNGSKAGDVTAVCHYGNAFASEQATMISNTSFYRTGGSYPEIKRIAYDMKEWMTFGTSKELECGVVIDAGRVVPFDTFYVSTRGPISSAEISYSNDNEVWNSVDSRLFAEPFADAQEIYLNGIYTARYFELKYTATAYTVLHGFYPFVSLKSMPRLTLKGSDNMELLRGKEYVEPGFDAQNANGEDISANVYVTGHVDTDTVGEYILLYTIHEDGFPPLSVERKVTVKAGIRSEGDMAFEKDVTVSVGTGGDNLTDGNPFTSWRLSNSSGEAVIDLGGVTDISQIRLLEDGDSIISFAVYASADQKVWKKVIDGNAMGDFSADIEPMRARYVKLVILSAAADPAVSSMEVYFTKEGKLAAAYNALNIDGNLSSVTKDLALAESGLFGTRISWQSDKPEVISNKGIVKRQGSDQNVTLTATIDLEGESIEKVFSVKVLKKPDSGSTGRSGGGGGGGQVSTVKMPVIPPVELPSNEDASEEGEAVFRDVAKEHWAYEYIAKLYKAGLIYGREDGRFAPDETITRAEFLKLLFGVFKIEAEESYITFDDVSKGDWYFPYVATGVSLGIARGKGGGIFGPDDAISRQDMCVITVNAAKAAGISFAKERDEIIFDDAVDIDDYAVISVNTLSRAHIISGDENNRFSPAAAFTRAQAAKIAAEIYEKYIEGSGT